MLNRPQPAPLKPDDGPNFTTHHLVREGDVWRFRPTGSTVLFPRVFKAFGYLFMAVAVLTLWQSLFNSLALLCGGALAVGVGRYLAMLMATGARFDTLCRRVEIPDKATLRLPFSSEFVTTLLDFAEVSEIEIVPKRVTDSEIDDYDNYELNLVTDTGRRFNLVSHPDGDRIAREAQQLSTVLGKSVADWRAVSVARNA